MSETTPDTATVLLAGILYLAAVLYAVAFSLKARQTHRRFWIACAALMALERGDLVLPLRSHGRTSRASSSLRSSRARPEPERACGQNTPCAAPPGGTRCAAPKRGSSPFCSIQRMAGALAGRKENGPKRPVFHSYVAERTGLEPATPGVTGRYSNQLNYHS